MSNPNVDVNYIINYVEIKPWPPRKDLGDKLGNRSAFIQWKHDDNNSSGSTSGDPIKGEVAGGRGVGDGKIDFKSFELYVTLPRDTSVKSGEDETFVKNWVEFKLCKMDNFEEGQSLATAVIDFAKYGIVQDSLMIMGVPMKFKTNKTLYVHPMLFVTMQAVDAEKKPLFISDRSLTPPGKSIYDPAGFWSDIASKFYSKRSKNPDVTKGKGKINNIIKGFKRGEISSNNNICHHCLDKNIESGKGDNVALIWEGKESNVNDKLTYKKLLEKVCQLANFLKKQSGVKKGDKVIIFLPMIMELPITMLACARIGAVQLVVVVAEYSSKSLSKIIKERKPKIVVTCNAVMKTKEKEKINLKNIVNSALSQASTALPEASQTSQTRISEVKCLDVKDKIWQDGGSKHATCNVEPVKAEDRLFILYTSESTEKPKEQTTEEYMIYTATTFKCAFDCKESDVYWCTTDRGWITDTMHSYVTYGPLLNGAAVVLYEGIPDYPDAGRCWNIVDKHKVTLFYTVPQLVQSLMNAGDQYVTRSSRKSLRVLGCLGEPLKQSEWRWFFNVVGDSRYPTSEIWCQREAGGSKNTSLPGTSHQEPGSATLPFFAVKGEEIDDEGIVIKGSWPGTFKILYGDQKTTDQKLFSVHYFKDGEKQASSTKVKNEAFKNTRTQEQKKAKS